jgi:hypothetical protein
VRNKILNCVLAANGPNTSGCNLLIRGEQDAEGSSD